MRLSKSKPHETGDLYSIVEERGTEERLRLRPKVYLSYDDYCHLQSWLPIPFQTANRSHS